MFKMGLDKIISAVLHGTQNPLNISIISLLINEFSIFFNDFTLVLEDYHVFDAP